MDLKEPLQYWRLPKSFIAQGRTVTMRPKVRQVTLGQLKPYAVGHQCPEVANDVFNGMSTAGLVAYHVALDQHYGAVLSSHLAL
jgi:hypothetical protein